MSLWKIAWRSMQTRGFSSLLTAFSMALGVALVIVVIVVHSVINEYFNNAAHGYHLIVGAKGGRLQLVFNTVYHLSKPVENIPWSYYQEFVEKEPNITDEKTGKKRPGKFASVTKLAIPLCMGDSFIAGDKSFRVVGTTTDFFDKLQYGTSAEGKPLTYQFASGRNFKKENFFEAVMGSVAAAESGVKVGDTVQPAHGIVESGDDLDIHDGFQVVGILEPSGTPNDRAVFVNMEGFYLLDGHAKPADAESGESESPGVATSEAKVGKDAAHDHDNHAHGAHDHKQPAPLPESQREVTSVLVLLTSDLMSQSVFTMVNEGQYAQAVFPVQEIKQFFMVFVDPIQLLLLLLTALIVIVAGIGNMVAIYNSMSERSHDIAVMRALGAGRNSVMLVILMESILLAVAGGLLGILLGHGLLALCSPQVVSRTGVALHAFDFNWFELQVIPALVVLASIMGIVPALVAYRTDVAKALSANP